VSLKALVVCPPGLEQIVASEMSVIGVRPGRVVFGGVSCEPSQAQLYALNLRLRTATRVLLRLGNAHVDGPISLARFIGTVDWPRFVDGAALTVSASSSASTLFHTEMIAEHTQTAIGTSASLRDEGPVQRVLVRIDHDRAVLSIDSSGERLDRRGYRLEGAKAPMRESLAAALVLVSGWDAASPLVDPFCGSGTIAIEAALIAGGLAPGRNRRFAFMDWPSFTRSAMRSARAGAEMAETGRSVPILASDRDAGAARAAQANAARAGVTIDVSQCAMSAVRLPAGLPGLAGLPSGLGHIVTNPPYGVRVGDVAKLRDLYDGFGNWLRANAGGWTCALVDGDRTLTSRVGIELENRARVSNGPIPVSFMVGVVPPGDAS
jgi:putative N6-adenine-specific DNA methylase